MCFCSDPLCWPRTTEISMETAAHTKSGRRPWQRRYRLQYRRPDQRLRSELHGDGRRPTPTIAEVSRIEQAYLESDQRKYYVPCPHCATFQILRWAQAKWPDRKPAEAWYECERCHGHIADHHKPEMLERGEWRAQSRSGHC